MFSVAGGYGLLDARVYLGNVRYQFRYPNGDDRQRPHLRLLQ